MIHATNCPTKTGADGCECAEHYARKHGAAPAERPNVPQNPSRFFGAPSPRPCVTLDCQGCGGIECPYKRPTSLAEAQHTESIGGSPSCLTWPPRPPIL